MALITFQDLPSTSTPLNAANLNNNFNACYDKASISIYASADGSSSSAFGTVAATTDTTILKEGTKLSLNSNAVKVGSGISKVRVSGVVSGTFTNNSSSNSYTIGARILINGTATANPRVIITIKPSETLNVALPVTPHIISVSENDKIQIGIYSSTANVSKTCKEGTYLFVEEVK